MREADININRNRNIDINKNIFMNLNKPPSMQGVLLLRF